MMKKQFINKIHRSGCCIYCIENITKGKKYIGQSRNITSRRKSHRQNLIKGKHSNSKMQEDFNSGDVFEIKALEYFPPWTTQAFLNGKEHAYIQKHKSDVQGYNIAPAPPERLPCRPRLEKYHLNPAKVGRVISHINKHDGLTYLRIYDLCRIFNCQPDDLMEYIPEQHSQPDILGINSPASQINNPAFSGHKQHTTDQCPD